MEGGKLWPKVMAHLLENAKNEHSIRRNSLWWLQGRKERDIGIVGARWSEEDFQTFPRSREQISLLITSFMQPSKLKSQMLCQSLCCIVTKKIKAKLGAPDPTLVFWSVLKCSLAEENITNQHFYCAQTTFPKTETQKRKNLEDYCSLTVCRTGKCPRTF